MKNNYQNLILKQYALAESVSVNATVVVRRRRRLRQMELFG